MTKKEIFRFVKQFQNEHVAMSQQWIDDVIEASNMPRKEVTILFNGIPRYVDYPTPHKGPETAQEAAEESIKYNSNYFQVQLIWDLDIESQEIHNYMTKIRKVAYPHQFNYDKEIN